MKYLVLLTLFLVGCSVRTTPSEFESLIKTCEGNGGAESVLVSSYGSSEDKVYCKSGVIIQRFSLKGLE